MKTRQIESIKLTSWLEAIADEDSQDMSHRVHKEGSSMDTSLHLHVPEPHVTLTITLINVSVYTLTLTKVEGKMTFHDSLLQHQPEIQNKDRELKHAGHFKLELCQELQPSTVQQILGEGKAEFGVGKVAVWFTYQDRFGTPQRARIAFGNKPFLVAAV
jgi:hypothetical protein